MKKGLLFTLLCLIGIGIGMTAKAANEVYSVFVDATKTLTFYYDDQRATRPGDYKELYNPDAERFLGYNDQVKTIQIDESMKDIKLMSTRAMFYGMTEDPEQGALYAATKIEGLENLDTKNVTDMSMMFYACVALESLDLHKFNTAKVTTMKEMFRGCSALKTLNISSFNTSEVTNMEGMFRDCESGKSLNISHFNTSNVEIMRYMFKGCTTLKRLTLGNFKVDKVEDMGAMFYGCSSLTTIQCDEDWSKVSANSTAMFDGCSSLVGGKGTKYDNVHKDAAYARPDGGSESNTPGYFTRKDTGTGVENMVGHASDVSIQKVLRDGVIFIERNGSLYDLNGRSIGKMKGEN